MAVVGWHSTNIKHNQAEYFSISGEVKITMTPYIREVIEDFSKYDPGSKTARTPAADHLFKVRDDAKPISEKLAQTFHTFVAKLLFATKRARPDIATAVSFLTTRVIEPDKEDWKKGNCGGNVRACSFSGK